jgi:two-component system, cell cycle sensor histidine kinase and response regulator CckA
MFMAADDADGMRCYHCAAVAPQEKESDEQEASSTMGDVAVLVCDDSGTVRWWSKEAERLLGHSSAQAVGKTLTQLLGVEASAVLGDERRGAPSTARTSGGGVAKLWRSAVAIHDPKGGRLFVQLLWPQTSSQIRAAGQPAGLEDQVGTLATRIAHDFASLLTPIVGNAMLLEEELPDQHPMHRRLVAIRQATEDARRFAQRLMALDPRRKLALHPSDLAHVVREYLPELRSALRPNIELVTGLDACLDGVSMDRKQICHALLELALNAQEAMPSGGTLAVSVAVMDGHAGDTAVPPGRWVRLQVRDTGEGMDPTLLEHAFEPFVSTKVPSCGGGLGLPMVAAVVRQHGGLLDVHSTRGRGTTISIYLPSDGPSRKERTGVGHGKPALDAATAHAHILLVEDNAMVRRSIEATLRGLGYRVTAVGSGAECIQTVSEATDPIDLLITDVVMPEMSGKELAEHIRDIVPDLQVLYMSGYDRSALAGQKQSAAVEHFLQKPFDGEDLSAAIVKAMAPKDAAPKDSASKAPG